MQKPKLLFRAPVLVSAGYGVHSRQLLQALIDCDKFDISVIPTVWGNCSFIYEQAGIFLLIPELARKAEENKQKNVQYDFSIQVSIASEFEKMARHNIGVTAGIETDRVTAKWIQKINEAVDIVIVPSKHSAEVLISSKYQEPNGKVLQVEKQVFVVPEGVDSSIYNPTTPTKSEYDFETNFNFLCVGLGLQQPFIGEDRKNISSLIKWFCESFKDNKDVGLVLKVALIGGSKVDHDLTAKRISDIKKLTGVGEYPKIYLIHGRLSDQEMASLYTHPKIKAYVTPACGEGFGLPILEAAACSLPVIATDWSGHLDFLIHEGKRKFVPLNFDLKPVPDSSLMEDSIERGANWAHVKEDHFKSQLRKVVLSYDTPKKWANELGEIVRTKFDVKNTNKEFANLVYNFYKEISKAPELQKVLSPKDVRDQLGVPEGSKTLLYTMPMSAGDVYISTAVVDSLKKKFPEHLIFFATSEQYQSILKNNKNIFKVVKWENWMMDVPTCEKIFDEVFTPNLAIQLNTSNWIHGGKGRKLADEMAAQCQVELGDYWIEEEKSIEGFPPATGEYLVFNPGSGKGQWEARGYKYWQEVIDNIKEYRKDLNIVQVGLLDDPLYEGVIDLRGKTNYNQLAHVVDNSLFVFGIDSVTSHMAAGMNVDSLAIYGSSYASSTGPSVKNGEYDGHIGIDTPSRYSCDKACYKYTCSVDKENPCINEIDPADIFAKIFEDDPVSKEKFEDLKANFKRFQPKIAGYTTILNGNDNDYPWRESIGSLLGFCDEVVVVDGGSKDGTYEELLELARAQEKLKIYQVMWDYDEPGMDGMLKAHARAMVSVSDKDFCWQQDCDEIVHEDDYEKIKKLAKTFPKNVDMLMLPVVEFWSNKGQVRTDRWASKWRLSRNSWKITHGIQGEARVMDPETGRIYSKKGMSDGCYPINIMPPNAIVPSKNFWTQELELLRLNNPQEYGKRMNVIFNTILNVQHFSWFDLARKIKHFKTFWNRQWNSLFWEDKGKTPEDRFPDVDLNNPKSLSDKISEMENQGGEHFSSETFKFERSFPAIMKNWIEKRTLKVE